MTKELTPHNQVIERLGGISELARKMTTLKKKHFARSTVQGWWDAGRIPSQHLNNVFWLGRFLIPPVIADDFVKPEVEIEEKTT